MAKETKQTRSGGSVTVEKPVADKPATRKPEKKEVSSDAS